MRNKVAPTAIAANGWGDPSCIFEAIQNHKLRKVGNLLSDGVKVLGDGVDLLGDGGDPRSIAGGSSKTTVAQKGDQRLEIRKCDLLTDQLTYLHG